VRIARLGVEEKARRVASARADQLPQLSSDANLWHIARSQSIDVPAGAWGKAGGQWVPAQPVQLTQGLNNILLANTTLGQPLTQLFRIREGVRIAQADERISEAEAGRAELQVTYAVHELYCGLLVSRRRIEAARAQIAWQEERLRESREAVDAGNVLEVSVIGSRASLLESRHALLEAEDRVSDLTAEFDDLLGLASGTEVELAEPEGASAPAPSADDYLQAGLQGNPDVRSAAQLVAKARSAVGAARSEYIPDIAAFARHTYQSGVPFISRNNGTVGFQMNWKLFDFGKRADLVAERRALLAQAEENLRRVKNRVSVEVEKSYRKLARAQNMIEVADEALALRRESERLAANRVAAGVAPESARREAEAATRKAEADRLQAAMGVLLARAELDRVAGKAAGQKVASNQK
jgi:outer membrane protein TolC